jgi:PAS domain S-box-containing protein
LATAKQKETETFAEHLDAVSLAKVQQAISKEIEMGKLLSEVMHIVMENAGAQSGFLLFERDGVWQIVAKGGASMAEVASPLPIALDRGKAISPGVVRFVARTRETVVLDDAARKGEFVNDPHIRHEKTKSLLCAPLLSRGRLIGILYLENNLTTQAFNKERVSLLEILVSQAAISLENARIYEALRTSEERFRTVAENSPIIVFSLDRNGVFTLSEGRGLTKLGLRPGEVVGKTVFEVYKHNPSLIKNFNRVIAGEAFIALDEEAGIVFETRWTPIRGENGKVNKVIGVSVDITDRKRAENALRKSEAKYRSLIDTSNEGIWMLGPDTMTTFVNTQMAEMLGYKPEEIIGHPVTDFMFEEDIPYHLQKMKNRRKGIAEHYERRYRRKDGQTVWALISASPILDHEGRFQGAFGMHTDITEHKQYEERQRDFYRRTILAATDGKLQLTEREEIEKIAGQPLAVFKVENAEDFHNVRVAVMEIALSLGMDEVRAGDYVVAVGEAVTNSVKHASSGTVLIHSLPGTILTVVSDNGPGIEAMSIPEVALKKGYTTAGTLGMGYKVMLSIADKVYLATGSWGTTVGIEMNIKPPETKLDLSAMYHALK